MQEHPSPLFNICSTLRCADIWLHLTMATASPFAHGVVWCARSVSTVHPAYGYPQWETLTKVCVTIYTVQEPSQLGYCVDTGLAVMLQCHLVIKTSLLNYKGATCTWDYKKSILAFHVDDPASISHTFCSCGHIQESIFPDTEINIQHVYISFKYLSDSLTEC